MDERGLMELSEHAVMDAMDYRKPRWRRAVLPCQASPTVSRSAEGPSPNHPINSLVYPGESVITIQRCGGVKIHAQET
jgi:hypothetical protein